MDCPQNPQQVIMVAADDLAAHVVLRSLFGAAGFQVISAVTGADALATLAMMRVDLVLADPPGGVAVDPVQRWVVLDALRQTAGTPIAILTAHNPALFAAFPAQGVARRPATLCAIDEMMAFVRRLLGWQQCPDVMMNLATTATPASASGRSRTQPASEHGVSRSARHVG